MEQRSKLSQLAEYIKATSGDQGVEVVKTCLDILHQAMPLEIGQVFTRLERITSVSEDLAYVIMCINKYKSNMVSEIRKIRDPEFTMLTRKGRPSTQAVECEIRFTHPELYDKDKEVEIVSDIEKYLQHIEKSLDRYMWLLRDKIQYTRG